MSMKIVNLVFLLIDSASSRLLTPEIPYKMAYICSQLFLVNILMEIDYLSWTLNRLNIRMQILSSEILFYMGYIFCRLFSRDISVKVC